MVIEKFLSVQWMSYIIGTQLLLFIMVPKWTIIIGPGEVTRLRLLRRGRHLAQFLKKITKYNLRRIEALHSGTVFRVLVFLMQNLIVHSSYFIPVNKSIRLTNDHH